MCELIAERTTDPKNRSGLAKREELVLERLSEIPQRRHEPSEVHPCHSPRNPNDCGRLGRSDTNAHQRTQADTNGHQTDEQM
jgi:hypothetical protein